MTTTRAGARSASHPDGGHRSRADRRAALLAFLVLLLTLPSALAACGSRAGASVRTTVAAPHPAPDGTPLTDGCTARTATGWVAAENARPGTPLAVPPRAMGDVLGYLDAADAVRGDVVAAHLALVPRAQPRQVRLVAYRLGWYRGAGARVVWHSPAVRVGPGAVPSGVPAPHLVQPRWPATLGISVDAAWVPGFYLLVPQDLRARPVGPAVPLVVRDPCGREPILFKASTLTWNAYDEWGGWSLYHGPSGSRAQQVADRARVVALQRPLTGSGYDQLLAMDVPVVHLLEQLAVTRHLDVAYTTDTAVDADPAQLLTHAEIVSGGHSEYWTTSMYDGLLAAADAGVNLVFLGANNLWWHARLEGGTPGDPPREVVYRSLAEDPVAATDPAEATIQWQAWPLGRDPAAVLGQSHAAIGVHGGLQLFHPPAWFVAGTRLGDGSVLPGAVGNEADGLNPAGHNPAHLQVLAAGVLTGAAGAVPVTTSYSTRPSGAAVFAAGTTDWACAPTGRCLDGAVPPATGREVAILTDNVLTALATPQAGLSHPAAATAPPTVAALRPSLSRLATGTYGGAGTEGVRARARR